MISNLPRMTHLQFALAQFIPLGGIWAVDLSDACGIAGPKFYQAIGRMINNGWIDQSMKPCHGTREGTWYKLTNKGQLEAQRNTDFYTKHHNL